MRARITEIPPAEEATWGTVLAILIKTHPKDLTYHWTANRKVEPGTYSVIDITEDQSIANGIKFGEYSVRALTKGMHKALALFQTPALLDHYRKNAMRANFSWELTAQRYLDIYRSVLGQGRVF